MQYTSYYPSPLGRLFLSAKEDGLTGAWFEGQKYFARNLNEETKEKERGKKILIRKEQEITMQIKLKRELFAPVKKGQKIGEVTFCLDGKKLISYPVLAKSSVEKLTYRWYAQQVFQKYFH